MDDSTALAQIQAATLTVAYDDDLIDRCVDLKVAGWVKWNAIHRRLNAAVRKAAEGPLKGIVRYVDEPLVSVDFNHSAYSSEFDAPSTKVIGGKMVKVLAWYDNEWGYSCRLLDLAKFVSKGN